MSGNKILTMVKGTCNLIEDPARTQFRVLMTQRLTRGGGGPSLKGHEPATEWTQGVRQESNANL